MKWKQNDRMKEVNKKRRGRPSLKKEKKLEDGARESDGTCLVVSTAMHSGRGHFLFAVTPATPAPRSNSGLVDERWCRGTGPREGQNCAE